MITDLFRITEPLYKDSIRPKSGSMFNHLLDLDLNRLIFRLFMNIFKLYNNMYSIGYAYLKKGIGKKCY